MEATQTSEYVTRQELVELEEQVKRRWKTILVLMVLASRAGSGTPVESKPAATHPAAATQAVADVLLINADPSSSNELSAALESAGFKVTVITDSTEGLGRLNSFSLIIVDGDLPGCEALCQRIRELSAAPIILLGSDPSGRAWDRAVEVGADAYLMRTVSRSELVARLKAILRRYKSGAGAKGSTSNV